MQKLVWRREYATFVVVDVLTVVLLIVVYAPLGSAAGSFMKVVDNPDPAAIGHPEATELQTLPVVETTGVPEPEVPT